MGRMKKRSLARKELTRRQFVKKAIGTGVAVAGARYAPLASALGGRGASAAGTSVGGSPGGGPSVEVESEFDYIVVGSGAGGAPVAVNLAKAGYRVLILEAGGIYPVNKAYPNYDVPAFHPFAVDDPEMRWDFFVKHYSDPEQQRRDSKLVCDEKTGAEKGILYPRASTVGGCTAHNAMVILYPDNKDWDDIAKETRDESWNASDMREYYRRVEKAAYFSLNEDFSDQRRGYGGWLNLEEPFLTSRWKDIKPFGRPRRWQMHSLSLAAAGAKSNWRDAYKLFLPPEANDWSYVTNKTDGVVKIPKATRQGHRVGTRELVLNALKDFPNLKLWTDCLASRVIFEEKENKAVGIEYIKGAHAYRADPNFSSPPSGTRRFVKAKREIILSGGAFNSPQLLMLSGVGPREELNKFRIKTRAHLPGVGKNLQDRYEVGVVSRLKVPFDAVVNCTFKGDDRDPCMAPMTLGGFRDDPMGSIYSSNGPVVATLKRSKADMPNPDLCIFSLPGLFRGYFPNWSREWVDNVQKTFTWAILKGHTSNRTGTVTLKSANPWDTPDINFNFFANDPGDDDLNAVVQGVEHARSINANPLLKDFVGEEILPAVKGDDLKKFIKNESWGHHASCSNKMGYDEMAVVDSKFRVHGTKGLRVVDASVFPRVPGLFIVAPIFMIAEKASDDILAAARTF